MKFYFLLIFLFSCGPMGTSLYDHTENLDTTSSTPKNNDQVIIADRFYIRDLFLDVFGNEIEGIINGRILFKPMIFGGITDFYDSSIKKFSQFEFPEARLKDNNPGKHKVKPSSIIKEGWIIDSCLKIYKNYNDSFNSVFSKNSIDKNKEINKEDVQKIYELFYSFSEISDETYNEIYKFEDLIDNEKKWDYVLLSICVSPFWKVL